MGGRLVGVSRLSHALRRAATCMRQLLPKGELGAALRELDSPLGGGSNALLLLQAPPRLVSVELHPECGWSLGPVRLLGSVGGLHCEPRSCQRLQWLQLQRARWQC